MHAPCKKYSTDHPQQQEAKTGTSSGRQQEFTRLSTATMNGKVISALTVDELLDIIPGSVVHRSSQVIEVQSSSVRLFSSLTTRIHLVEDGHISAVEIQEYSLFARYD